MRPKSDQPKAPTEKVVKVFRRTTHKSHSAEIKNRIVLEGLRGECQNWRHFVPSPISALGQKRKWGNLPLTSALPPIADLNRGKADIGKLMSVMPPKAEVVIRRWHFRFVPLPEVGMPVEEPSTASQADITPRSTLIRTVSALTLSSQEEALALAGSDLARHDESGVVDQILGCLEHV